MLEAVPWSAVEAIFNALIGPDRHGLETWPAVAGNVSASWLDGQGVLHRVDHLDAYQKHLTYRVGFSSFGGDVLESEFFYRPGTKPPGADAKVKGSPAAVDAAIAVV